MNIVLVWIQWSGKGTQARLIVDKFSYSFFEMWQKLRNFAWLVLPESSAVKKCLEAWSLVPIELTGKILTHYMESHKESFILFDWIPRSIDQKEMFDMIVWEYSIFYLDLSKSEAIKRLLGRRIDPITWEWFPWDFVWEINPKTWNKLVTRDDDKPEAVIKRVDIFYQNTMPLLTSWAHSWKKIYNIDASKNVLEVFAQIEDILENKFYTINE